MRGRRKPTPMGTPALKDHDEATACLQSGSTTDSSIVPVKVRWKRWKSRTHSIKSSRQPTVFPHPRRVLASCGERGGRGSTCCEDVHRAVQAPDVPDNLARHLRQGKAGALERCFLSWGCRRRGGQSPTPSWKSLTPAHHAVSGGHAQCLPNVSQAKPRLWSVFFTSTT